MVGKVQGRQRLGLRAAGRGSELLPAPAMLLLLLACLALPVTNAPTIWHLLVRALLGERVPFGLVPLQVTELYATIDTSHSRNRVKI